MSEVVVVAVVHLKDGLRDEAERVIENVLIPGTHAEEGCVTFAVHRDTREPNTLVIVERWADGAALGAHMEAPHLAAFREKVGPMSAGPPDVYVLEACGLGDPTKGRLDS